MRWKVAMWSKDTTEPAMLRSPIVLIFLLFLWAGNVWLLEKMGISYHGVLSIKASPLTFSLVMAVILAIAYAVTITLFSNVLGLTVEASVTIFYVLLILSQTMLPATLPGQETKASFYRLLRIVFFPGSTISFSEVLLADALCSLSKVFKDYGVTIIAIYANISGASVVDLHEEGMLLCALLASLPFWLRVRQCWVQLEGCKDSVAKIPITLNIIKYISAFPPIWLAAAASLGYFHPALPTFTAAMATINSVYSYLVSDLYPFYFLAICRLVGSADFPPPSSLNNSGTLFRIGACCSFHARVGFMADSVSCSPSLHTSLPVLSTLLFALRGRRTASLPSPPSTPRTSCSWSSSPRLREGPCGTFFASSGRSSCRPSGLAAATISWAFYPRAEEDQGRHRD